MPNKKAAKKHLRHTVKRTKNNSLVKRNIKELIKKGERALKAGNDDKIVEYAKALQKAVDKAIKTGILKSNTGNRKKSRFMSKLDNKHKTAKPKKESK